MRLPALALVLNANKLKSVLHTFSLVIPKYHVMLIV